MLGGVARHVRCPHAESAVTVGGPSPLTKELALRLLLLIVLPLRFQNGHPAVGEPSQVVRAELANGPLNECVISKPR